MQAAAHGATFVKAKQLRRTMTPAQLHEFSIGSERGKPEHVKKRPDPRPGGNRYNRMGKP
jgi:hypothetical protein